MKHFFLMLCLAAGLIPGRTQPNDIFSHPQASFPERASPGDTLRVSYHPVHPAARACAILYIFDTLYHWRVTEVPLRNTDTAWTARIPLPPAAGFLAWRFLSARTTNPGDTLTADNNHDIGLFTMVYRPDGRFMPGAEAGYGLLRSPHYGMGIPGYFDHFSISDTATYIWLSNEILRNHNSGAAKALVLPYLRAKSKYTPEKAPAEIDRALHYLLTLPAPTEETLVKAWLVATTLKKDTALADSIRTALLAKFPNGALARKAAYDSALKAKTVQQRYALGRSFLARFPQRPETTATDHLLDIRYPLIYRQVFSIAIADKHPEMIFDYKDALPFENIPEIYYKAVEIPYDDWKSMDAKTAFPFSDALYKRLLWFHDHQPAEYWYLSPSEWEAQYIHTTAIYFRLHARILMELGRDTEALALTKRAQLHYRYTSADLDETEAILLQRSGDQPALDTLLHTAVRENQVTPIMIDMLRAKYEKTHGGNTGFDAWLESLKDARTRHLMEEEIRASRRSLSAPEFNLLDAEGHRVRLSSLRGKTVVLDFWATWCAPCKAAMAGMNLAVNKCRQDTSVVFYFIDTQERLAGFKQKALAFPKDNGYPFSILFDDGPSMDSAYNTYSRLIHTSGIPFKVIIDPAGIVRFANIGYKGSPSGLADEIGIMIELARHGDQPTARAPTPYHSDSVFYYNDSIRIGATLTYPDNPRAHTAIILLSGTGKQDRDGTMAGHKLFAVLADSLTRRGFAVLRSDDRGTGASGGSYESATTADFATDALAAVNYLRSRKDLSLQHIGLLGHSEGGMAAGIAAARDNHIGFVITLSSPGVNGLDALLIQNRTLVHAANIPPLNKLRFDSINHLLFQLVYDSADAPHLDSLIRRAYAKWRLWDDSLVQANHLADGGHFFFPLESYIRQATGPWYRYFIRYDPAEVLPKVTVPWLAINGDKDRISDPSSNLQGIAAALAKGGNHHVTTWLAPGLNHLYQHCHTGDPAEYTTLPETMAPELATRVGEWVQGLP